MCRFAKWGWDGSIGEARTAPVSETLVTVLLSTMQLACNMFTLFDESNGCHHSFQHARPRTHHVVASTICFVPKLFVKQILLPISAIFEGEREGGKGSVRRANSVSRSLIAWSALGPSYRRTASAMLDWKLVCNPRIRPFALV
jgi:hypothetical protein